MMKLGEIMYVIQNIKSPVFTDDERRDAIERYCKTVMPRDIADKILDFVFERKGSEDEWSWV